MPRRLAISLLLALLTTITIAWLAMPLPRGNNWYGPPTTSDLGYARAADGKFWQLSRGDRPGHTVVSYWFMQISGMGLSMPNDQYEQGKYDWTTLPAHLRPDQLTDLNMQAWFHATGWPRRALSCSVHWKRQILNSNITYTVNGGIQLPRDASFNPRALPLTPIWSGLLINTALYALIWLAALTTLARLRERHRRKHNLCPSCKYNRAGIPADSPCPECGRAP